MAVPRLRVEVDYEQLKKAGVDIKQVFGQIGVGADVVEKKMRNTEKALKSQERQFHALKASLDPVFAAQQRYQRQVQLLDDALRRGLIKSQDEHNRLLTVARQKYSDAATGAGGFARKVSGELASMATSYLGVAAAIGVFTRALGGSISEAIEAERAYSRLEFTVTRNAERIGASADQLAKFAAELQKTTAFDDESIMGAMEALSRFAAVNGANIEELTKLTLDYASVTGKDAVAAAQALGKALDEPGDSLRALKDIGVVLNRQEEQRIDLLMKSGREWEAQAIILERVRESIQGMAERDAATAFGQWQQFKNRIGELGEQIGGVLIQATSLWVKLNSISKFSFWRTGGEQPTSQQFAVPISEITSRSGSDAVDSRAMEAASQRVIQALEAEEKAATKTAAAVKTLNTELSAHAIAPLEGAGGSLADRVLGGNSAEFERAMSLFRELVPVTRDWAGELAFVEKNWQSIGLTQEDATRLMDAIKEKTGEAVLVTEDLGETWASISADIQENFIRGIQDTFASAIEQILTTGKVSWEDLWKTVFKLFAQMIAQMIVKWIFLEKTKTAITAKEAGKRAAIDGASGGGGGGEGLSGWSKYASWFSKAKAWYQGGGSSTVGTWGGILVAALTVAAVLYNANKRKQAEEGQKRESSAQLWMSGGEVMSGGFGRLRATSQQMADAMLKLFNTLESTSRSGITSMDRVVVDISNNKRYFDAKVGDLLLGHFTSAEEAMVKAVSYAFATAEGDIDSVVRLSLKHFTGKSMEDLTKAAELIQKVSDEFNFVSDLDRAITSVAINARSLTRELEDLGVRGIDAAITGFRSSVIGFRNAWESLSGVGLSPEEQKKRAEQSRALLLAQMKLEREKLAADIRVLQLRARMDISKFNLDKAALRGGTLFLQYQGKLWGAELDMGNAYLRGRGEFVKTEMNLFNAELEAMNAVLVELDKLIETVSVGEIRMRGGRGRGRGGGGGQSYHDRLISALERLINAVTALREFQASLAQDEQLSPYSMQRRFFMARASFTNLAQQAMSGNVSAIEQLPEAARLYLELAQQMFGRAGAGYGDIFAQVQAILQAISDQYPEGQDPQAWLRSDMEAVNNYLESLNLDGRRRREQHDETNRRLRHMEELLEQGNQQGQNNGIVMNRLLATRKTDEVRNGGKRAA